MCIATEVEGIKREIMTNGPVLGQLSPYTDLLTYSSGVYQRTNDAFKYNGNHIFKVVGWETSPEGNSNWIVENSWGSDWGENGYARIASGGDTTLDFYAISFAMYPKTLADYQMEQKLRQQMEMQQFESMSEDDLEGDIDQIFLDDDASVFEEGIDAEL